MNAFTWFTPRRLAVTGLYFAGLRLVWLLIMVVVMPSPQFVDTLGRLIEAFTTSMLLAVISAGIFALQDFVDVLRNFVVPALRRSA